MSSTKLNNSDKQVRILDAWLLDPDYEIWLPKAKDDNTVARCKLLKCFKIILETQIFTLIKGCTNFMIVFDKYI